MAIYEGRPYTDWDKNKELGIDVPVISHESGQRCIYPNFKEIPNFTGPVQARNFEVFRESLAANGMLDQADDFFRVYWNIKMLLKLNFVLLLNPVFNFWP